VEIPRNWRNQEHLIRKWRKVRYGPNGNGDGHNSSENPLKQPEVQNTSTQGDNGHENPITVTEVTGIATQETTT